MGGYQRNLQFIGRYETATANEPDCCLVSYVYWVQLYQAPKIAAEIAENEVDLDDQDTLLAPLTCVSGDAVVKAIFTTKLRAVDHSSIFQVQLSYNVLA